MLRSFGLRENCLRRNLTCSGEAESGPIIIPQESLWVDLWEPTPEESEAVKAVFGFDPPTKEDMEEIEISSRLYQEEGALFMTALVLWLSFIFGSFAVSAPPNRTILTVLFVCVFSASTAIFLILELGQPFDGLMQIPNIGLRDALAPLPGR